MLTDRKILYTDISRNLDPHPVSKDTVRIINEDAVKESIKNLLLIDKGEFLYRPNVGSDIKKLLFENATPDTFRVVEDIVRTTINNHEPRCNVIDVSVSGDIDSHYIQIQIVFNVINRQEPISIDVFLNRVR